MLLDSRSSLIVGHQTFDLRKEYVLLNRLVKALAPLHCLNTFVISVPCRFAVAYEPCKKAASASAQAKGFNFD